MRKNLNGYLRILLFAALSAAAVTLAHGQEKRFSDKTESPYFFVKGDPAVDHLPLKGTSVDIDVSGVIADVKVTQTYRNEGNRAINATYVFPASTRAAVYSMRMRIGDQLIYAKIKEREQAKEIFEKAKKEGKSASLLEEERPNVFTMSLANIMPGDEIEIELRYTELLVPTDGVYEVVYPTVVGPRYPSKGNPPELGRGKFVASPYQHSGETPASTLHINTRVAAGMPIKELSCISHQISPEWLDQGAARLTLDEADAFQGNRDFILRYKLAGDRIQSGLLLFQGEKENFFLYMAQPPARVAPDAIPPREYIFVVDVSGSMAGFPLDTAKHLLSDLIGHLRPTDYFNVVLFAGDSTTLAPRSIAATPENLSRAIDLIDQQRGNGGTELLPALQRAMQMPRERGTARSTVVITDGFISGESALFDYIRENLGGTSVFSFGIGTSVNRFLVEGVAKAGMGEPFVVTDQAEAEATAAKFREYIESPVLTNVAVRAAGFDVYDVEPQHLPDLMASRPVVVFGKWRGPATGTFELTGWSGSGEYRESFDVASAVPNEGNSALRYLWARSRIAELSDYGVGYVGDDRKRAITQLGLDYSLLTPYTSFVAVREKIVNPNGNSHDVNQPLPMPAGVSDLAVGSEPELIALLAMLVAGALFVIARRRREPIETA